MRKFTIDKGSAEVLTMTEWIGQAIYQGFDRRRPITITITRNGYEFSQPEEGDE